MVGHDGKMIVISFIQLAVGIAVIHGDGHVINMVIDGNRE